MNSSFIYQITQTLLIGILSIIGTFLCIGKNWFGRESILTMLLLGLSVTIIGVFSSYSSTNIDEFLSIVLLKKFSMTGRLLLIGYSMILTSLWLLVFNSLIRKNGREDEN